MGYGPEPDLYPDDRTAELRRSSWVVCSARGDYCLLFFDLNYANFIYHKRIWRKLKSVTHDFPPTGGNKPYRAAKAVGVIDRFYCGWDIRPGILLTMRCGKCDRGRSHEARL